MISYDDIAGIYDHDMGQNIGRRDIPFYLAQCAGSKRILELGCGTGRIMEAMVENDIPVTGIDSSVKMLQQAEKKLTQYDKTLWHLQQGDMSNFSLRDDFDAALCAFSTYSKLLDIKSERGFFRSVYQALKPDGKLLIDLFIQSEDFCKLPEGQPLECYSNRLIPGLNCTLTRHKTIWRDVSYQVNKVLLSYTITHDDGRIDSFELTDYTRYSSPKELLKMVKTSGFSIINIFGSFEQSPLTEGCGQIIIEAKRAKE